MTLLITLVQFICIKIVNVFLAYAMATGYAPIRMQVCPSTPHGVQIAPVGEGIRMRAVLNTSPRHIYSGWAICFEGRGAPPLPLTGIILDRTASHSELTKLAMEALTQSAQDMGTNIDLHLVNERQRGTLLHPSQPKITNVTVRTGTPTEYQVSKTNYAIESNYRQALNNIPLVPKASDIVVATATEAGEVIPGVPAFEVEAAGVGWVITGTKEGAQAGRGIIKVLRQDSTLAELHAIHSALRQVFQYFGQLQPEQRRAVLYTSNIKALDVIANPWRETKRRRTVAGLIFDLLHRVRCGENSDQYGVIFRCAEPGSSPWLSAAKEMADLASTNYDTIVEAVSNGTGAMVRETLAVNDKRQEEILDRLQQNMEQPAESELVLSKLLRRPKQGFRST